MKTLVLVCAMACLTIGRVAVGATSVPYAHTQPVTAIALTNATLNGMATPNGSAATAWFEWGATTAYGQTTTAVSVGAGNGVVHVRAVIANLQPHQVYHSRLVVSNALGTTRGVDQPFVTGGRIAAWGNYWSAVVEHTPRALDDVVAIESGAAHCLALRANGDVIAWGEDNYYGWGSMTNVPRNLTNVVAIAAGAGHNLVLRKDGTVFGWTRENDPNWAEQISPPAGLSNVVAIAAGNGHALALRDDGTVAVWGSGLQGQTNVPPGLSNIVAVAAGQWHCLALRDDGTVVAWGQYYSWSPFGEHLMVAPPGLNNVVHIAAGRFHSLAVRRDGTVVGFGDNAYGQANIPGTLNNVLAAAADVTHNLALRRDGTPVSWSQWVLPSVTNTPVGLSNVVAVSAGEGYNVILGGNTAPVAAPQTIFGAANQDVVVTLAGSDAHRDALGFRITTLPTAGALYQVTADGRGEPIIASNASVTDSRGRVIFRSAPDGFGDPYASFTFCANDGQFESQPAMVTLRIGIPRAATQPAWEVTKTLNGMATPGGFSSSAWFEWGTNTAYGQRTTPADVGNGAGVVRVTATLSNALAGRLYHYRLVVSNAAGIALGADQPFITFDAPGSTPTGGRVTMWGGAGGLPRGLSNVVAISSLSSHTLALRSDGTVIVWPQGTGGGTVEERLRWEVPAGLSTVIAISAGGAHNLALRSDGTVVAWGWNGHGQTNVPPGLDNVIAIAAGDGHSVALRHDGTVVTWGSRDYDLQNIPAAVTNIVAIAAGPWHILALRRDGTVIAWGDRTSGKIDVPSGLRDVVAITAGTHHNLALRSDGTVVAWGHNFYSQTFVPGDLRNVIAIAAGYGFSLALRSDGRLVTWGEPIYNVDSGYGPMPVPSGLSNVVAITAGQSHAAALGASIAPLATAQTVSGPANDDLVLTLGGSDLNQDFLTFRIVALPTAGTLYQFANGARGAEIVAANTPVNDPAGRIIYVPAPNGFGDPYATFSFVANDGRFDSTPATVTLRIGQTYAFTQPFWAVSGTLNGMVTLGFPSAVWFDWGTTTSYGQRTPPVLMAAATGITSVSARLTNLAPGQVYHARLVVSNFTGLSFGADQQFITFGSPPLSLSNGKVALVDPAGCVQISQEGVPPAIGGNEFKSVFNESTPRLPANLTNIVALSAGYPGFALRSDGTAIRFPNWWSPNPAGHTNVVAVASGVPSLALRIDGTLVSDEPIPSGISNIIAIAANSYSSPAHFVALRRDGKVFAWGLNNSFGQTNLPSGLNDAVAVAAGGQHGMALRKDGTVVAWGGTSGESNVPPDLDDVVAIAAGNGHSLALRSDGIVIAWGSNWNQRAGVPAGLSNVVAIAAGSSSLALRSDGTVVEWSCPDRPTTWTLSNVVAISASSYNLALAANALPMVYPADSAGPPNSDLLVWLSASDLNNDALIFRIATLPDAGTLYQVENDMRGAAITAPQTRVTDPRHRLIFVPATDEAGEPYASFTFVASDGESDSVPVPVTISLAPLKLRIAIERTSFYTNSVLRFIGAATNSYRVSVSSNLMDWRFLGIAWQNGSGRFEFHDPAVNLPARFYKVATP